MRQLVLEKGIDRIFIGANGKITLGYSHVTSDPPEIAEEALRDIEKGRNATVDHMRNWLECVKSREKPASDIETGHRSTVVCHLGNIVGWVGRTLRWDPEKEVFPGDDEANAYLERSMRKPYQLPDTT